MVRELLHISYHPDHEHIEEIKDRLGLEMYELSGISANSPIN
ncbi:hypothetical protein [Paenibacillus sp. FSL R5-0923]